MPPASTTSRYRKGGAQLPEMRFGLSSARGLADDDPRRHRRMITVRLSAKRTSSVIAGPALAIAHEDLEVAAAILVAAVEVLGRPYSAPP